ncbi:MAG: inner-rane translocator [Deltaproteobacteria bacterium]|jgi:branched-chain amino acid transport system permease protein|nr:inner-rane translocator [Deltaproteobacteria bacterium]
MDSIWSTLVIQILHGLAYGMLLFLVASGLTLVFGMMSVLNLAHASFYMLGAYFSYQMLKWIGNFWIGLLICPILVAMLGILMERFLLRRVHAGGHVQEFVLTAGIAFVIMESVKWIWGTEPLPVPIPAVLSGSVMVMGSVYPVYRLFILFFSIGILGLMAYILLKTRLGITVRAAVSDRDMVSALGTNTPFVFMLVMGIGTWLAGVAGVIAGPFISTYPGMAGEILVDCFVVTVTGGLGSLMGAVLASFIIGQISSFGILLIPRFAIVFAFLLMAIVLIIKPSGLFGEKG